MHGRTSNMDKNSTLKTQNEEGYLRMVVPGIACQVTSLHKLKAVCKGCLQTEK